MPDTIGVIVILALIALVAIFAAKWRYPSRKDHEASGPRYLPDVIDEIIKQIPKGEYEPLRLALDSSKESVRFSSPEKMRFWWLSIERLLNNELADTKGTTWKEKALAIFSEAKQATLED